VLVSRAGPAGVPIRIRRGTAMGHGLGSVCRRPVLTYCDAGSAFRTHAALAGRKLMVTIHPTVGRRGPGTRLQVNMIYGPRGLEGGVSVDEWLCECTT